jgi:subfamily B ATP-binding cassette protein MsbA
MYFCSLFQNPAMKEFLRLMSLIKKYKGYAALNVLFNILTILFSVFSLGMIIPFLKMIFGLQELSKEPVAMSMDKDGLLNYVYYQMSLVIDKYGQEELLIGIAILTVVTFFFKNFFPLFSHVVHSPLKKWNHPRLAEHDLSKNHHSTSFLF